MISKIETLLSRETTTALLCLLVEQYGMDGRLPVNLNHKDGMTEHMVLDYEVEDGDQTVTIILKKGALS